MPDSTLISLDVETYGICETNYSGHPLPKQTVFEPRRMLEVDKVSPEDLIQTVSITTGAYVGPVPQDLDGEFLSRLQPGDTRVLFMANPTDRRYLRRWLSHATHIVGFNLPFDILCLRSYADLRPLIHKQMLITTDHLKFVYCDVMPESSLKDIGPAIALYSYASEKTAKNTRFQSLFDPDLTLYNARDSHRTLAAAIEFARLIARDYPDSAKLSPFALREMSETLWTCIRMTEAGDPLHAGLLRYLSAASLTRAEWAKNQCRALGVRLENGIDPATGKDEKGVDTIKRTFLNDCFDLVDTYGQVKKLIGVDSARLHTLYGQTAGGKVSVDDQNRAFVRGLLEHVDPFDDLYPKAQWMLEVLKHWDFFTEHNGNHTKYLAPLIDRKLSKTSKSPFDSIVVKPRGSAIRGTHPNCVLSHSLWYYLPGQFKDGQGGSGGQKQGRLSARNPQRQQWPPLMGPCQMSRWGEDGCIISMDLSQIELRVAGLLSGEPSIIEAYTLGKDLHTDRAVYIYGPEVLDNPNFKCGDRQTDPRQWSKQMNFADLYLAGALQLQSTIFKLSGKIFPLDFFYEIVRSRAHLRPGLIEWHGKLFEEADKNGYLILPFTGHSRIFVNGTLGVKPGGASPINEICNFEVQTVAAITMRSIQRYLHRHLPGINHYDPPMYLFANVHDAVKLDCKKSHKEEALSILSDAVSYCANREYWHWWETHLNRHVPLKYEIKIT